MVHMDSVGKPEVKVIMIKVWRFVRKCYCCAPVLLEEAVFDIEEDRGKEEEVRGKEDGDGGAN